MHSIIPDQSTALDFRAALGCFTTGVTVVTADSEIGPLGITANSFASVSLDPPLILWSPAKGSKRFRAFTEAEHFTVHVLAADQRDICQRFARDGADFDGMSWELNQQNVPMINGCLAQFQCRKIQAIPGGDHTVILAHVDRASWRDGDPLVFSQGKFCDVHAQ